jgi:glutaredoxin
MGLPTYLIFLSAGGNEIQGALQRLTGQYTVPNVFIGNSKDLISLSSWWTPIGLSTLVTLFSICI